MRLNRKGFMMAEVVVVSAVVLIFLATLYVSYNQIYGKYKSRVSYYDSVTLYRLSYFRDLLIENNKINDVLVNAKSNKITSVYNTDNSSESIFQLSDNTTKDRVFMIYNNKKNLSDNELNNFSNIHPTYKAYLNYLSSAVDLTKSNYVMIMEKCNINDDDKCNYAYLEIFDGYE